MPDEKRWRTEVPNIIDDLGLDPYERTLYVHYKRVCGGDGGQCTEGVRKIAEKTKMSVGKITQARKSLLDRGLIAGDVQHGKDSAITCPEIWDINTAYYADKNRPNIDGWTVKQLRQWVANCSSSEQLNGSSSSLPEHLKPDCSLDELNSSQYEQYCSPDEQKKEPPKKEPVKKLSSNDDSGKKPLEDSQKWNNANKKIVGDKFLELTHLKPPANKKTSGAWWGWLFEIFEMCGKDSAETCRVMGIVVSYMRHNRTDILTPKSLINYSRVVASGQELNGTGNYGQAPPRASPQTTILDPEQLERYEKIKESERRI